jgi:hypothetical protein
MLVPRTWTSSGPDATQLALSGPLSSTSSLSGSVTGSCQVGKVELKTGTTVVRLPGQLAMRVTDTVIKVAGRRSLRSVSAMVSSPSGVPIPVTYTDTYSVPASRGHECIIAFGGPDTEPARTLFQQLAATIGLP